MALIQEPVIAVDVRETAMHLAVSTDTSRPWIVNWTGIWVGALAALATALILGLIAIAVRAHEVGPGARIDKWSDVRLGALVFSVMGAFMSFVVGGWIAGKIAGVRRAETASLHGSSPCRCYCFSRRWEPAPILAAGMGGWQAPRVG